MPKAKKVKDFEKQKLKVGKKKPERSNATNTSFKAKALVLPSQMKDHNLANQLILLRHHHAPARRQAVANISSILHLHELETGEILSNVCPLMVDGDHQVRMSVVAFLKKIDKLTLIPHINLLLVYIHAAMTHITPAIRADSTFFLDVLMEKCPQELVRLGFSKTLSLYFPLLGWSLENKSRAGSVSTTLSFGKLAPKAKVMHLSSLMALLTHGLQNDLDSNLNLYHEDTSKFMIPLVANPFDVNVTDDVEARREALEAFIKPLEYNLGEAAKEGGESGRIAAKILTLVN